MKRYKRDYLLAKFLRREPAKQEKEILRVKKKISDLTEKLNRWKSYLKGLRELTEELYYEKRTTKDVWVIRRLKSYGFVMLNETTNVVWYSFNLAESLSSWSKALPSWNDASITAEIEYGRSLRKLSYRPRYETSIHLIKYMDLNTKDWSELESFIALCKRVEKAGSIERIGAIS